MMGRWVIFTSNRTPDVIASVWLPSAVWVENVDNKILETCRLVDGKWVLRDPEPVWEPTPPEPDPEPELPNLDRAQFAYLLALGPEDIWAYVEAMAKASDREIYAQLKELRERSSFNFEVTLARIAQFAPFLPDGIDLSRETLGAAWAKAAARTSEGAAT